MFPRRLRDVTSFTWQDNGTLITSTAGALQFYPDYTASLEPSFSIPVKANIVSLEVSNFADGMLSGGTDTGSVLFWKPAAARDASKALLKEEKLFSSPVHVMEFNAFKSNLLAVGGADVLILNLDEAFAKQSQSEFTFRPGGESEDSIGEISSLSWNPKVSHILAAASENGVAQVWDLRKTSTLFNIFDPNYMNKCTSTSLLWNPENPLQFIMAYNFDKSPVLQIWDLRNQESPIKEFRHAHEAGVTATAWNPHDTDLLMSFDANGKGVLWNFKNSEPILTTAHDLESSIAEARWVPHHYGIYSVLSRDGSLEVRSIYDTGVSHADEVVTEDSGRGTKQGYSVNHVPKWLQPKTCINFNFGGVLVCGKEGDKNLTLVKVQPVETPVGQIAKAAAQQVLDRQWEALAASISTLTGQSPADKLELDLILAKTHEDGVDRALGLLGLDKKAIMLETEQFTGKKRETTERRKAAPTETKSSDFSFAPCRLADRMMEERGDKAAALACLIVAEDTERAIKMWTEEAKERLRKKPGNYLRELSIALLKSVLFKSVIGNTKSNLDLERLAVEFIKSLLCTGSMDLVKGFIERLPITRPEYFDLKAIYDRVLGQLRQPKPQLWEIEAVPAPKARPQKAPVKEANPLAGKAKMPTMPAPQHSKVNPFPSQPDTSPPFFAKQPFKEEQKESIPSIPKTEPFKKVQAEAHEAPPARVMPPPMPAGFKHAEVPKAPEKDPFPPAPERAPPAQVPEKAPFAQVPERAPFGGERAPFADAQARQPPPRPAVPEIPKTATAQPMKTTPPPPAIQRVNPPGFKAPPAPQRVEVAAPAARSIPQEYSFVYQVWSQVTSLPFVSGNARLKAEAESKLEDLFRKLETGELGEHEGERLIALTQAFHSGDCQAALGIQMELVKSAWDANKSWLPVVKNLIKAKQTR